MVSAGELRGIDMFSQLAQRDVEAIAQIAREMTCSTGDVLFAEGDAARDVYMLLDGKITIRVKLSSRPESLVVASLGQPGQLVGWSGLVSTNYTASAHCDTDSHLLVINGQDLHQILKESPETGFIVMEHIASVIGERLRNIQRVILKTL